MSYETPTPGPGLTPDDRELAEWWQYYGHLYDARSWTAARPLLAEVIGSAVSAPLLDVGCGYGFFVECARRFGIPATGLEAAEPALEFARRAHPLADVRPWQAGEPMPLADDSVGAVLVNEFVDHVTLDENVRVFDEIHRVLVPGGTVIVKSPSRHNRFDDDWGHKTFFSPPEFRAFVEARAFEVLEQPYLPQPLLGSSRLGWLAMRMLARWVRPVRWAARIDLVARKPGTEPDR